MMLSTVQSAVTHQPTSIILRLLETHNPDINQDFYLLSILSILSIFLGHDAQKNTDQTKQTQANKKDKKKVN